jgi:lipopolysaccharide biosynthesis regulator YciM
MREAVDYEYVVDEKDKASVHIKLLSGEYKDTVFKYGKVGVKEEDNKAYLQFTFDVIQSPIKKLEKKLEFKNYLGDLLSTIITKQLDVEETYYDENRTDDTKESDIQ